MESLGNRRGYCNYQSLLPLPASHVVPCLRATKDSPDTFRTSQPQCFENDKCEDTMISYWLGVGRTVPLTKKKYS